MSDYYSDDDDNYPGYQDEFQEQVHRAARAFRFNTAGAVLTAPAIILAVLICVFLFTKLRARGSGSSYAGWLKASCVVVILHLILSLVVYAISAHFENKAAHETWRDYRFGDGADSAVTTTLTADYYLVTIQEYLQEISQALLFVATLSLATVLAGTAGQGPSRGRGYAILRYIGCGIGAILMMISTATFGLDIYLSWTRLNLLDPEYDNTTRLDQLNFAAMVMYLVYLCILSAAALMATAVAISATNKSHGVGGWDKAASIVVAAALLGLLAALYSLGITVNFFWIVANYLQDSLWTGLADALLVDWPVVAAIGFLYLAGQHWEAGAAGHHAPAGMVTENAVVY